MACDGMEQCVSGTDEIHCLTENVVRNYVTLPPPAILLQNYQGQLVVKTFKELDMLTNSSCPKTHFECPGSRQYCLPVFLRCNNVFDCPSGEDEVDCHSYVCPGFYRCRGSSVCVHIDHICDGLFGQCPKNDDELLCEFTCPQDCTCYGLAFFCDRRITFGSYRQLRYLEAQRTNTTLQDVSDNHMIIFLNLAQCGISHLQPTGLPNLVILDLSDNQLSNIQADVFKVMSHLRVLILSGNKMDMLLQWDVKSNSALSNLRVLDLSRVNVRVLDPNIFTGLHNLEVLNLSDTGLRSLRGKGFQVFNQLSSIDLDKCPLHDFPRNIFQGLDQLRSVTASNYKICCPTNLPPGFNIINCRAPSDEISSCESLLRNNFYRASLSVLAVLSLTGNLTSFLYRALLDRHKKSSGFKVFVLHLSVSDFLMGVYLSVIGVADIWYQGTYLWNDVNWRTSAACQLAGFLSLVSSEVSAIIICFITLDRFLVLRFPFSPLRFHTRSAHVASLLAWSVAVILAAVPMTPSASHWQFYSQKAICVPLPITRKSFAGHNFSFAVIIVLNFVLFLFVAAGQALIYASIQANSMASVDTSRKSKDLTIARRLITVAVSDFLCWFPIGLLGLLASSGFVIPGEINVVMAIFVLPLNAALNPFIYSVSMILEKKRRAYHDRLMKELLSRQKI